MDERNIVSAVLSGEAKRRLAEVAESLGMKQQELLGRLLEWYTEQDRLVQLIAVKQIPEDYTGDVVDLLYRKRHPEGAGVLDKADVERVARAVLDGLQQVREDRGRASR